MNSPKEYKVIALRECVAPDGMQTCDTPERAALYWRANVENQPGFNPEVECVAVLMLNTRRKVKGHTVISVGTVDTTIVHPREVFRAAIIASASAVILVHNHPSGECSPSDADIRITRELMNAGKMLRIELLDSIIVGHPEWNGRGYSSLREQGFFYS
jgi:DNA repair protein RadC